MKKKILANNPSKMNHLKESLTTKQTQKLNGISNGISRSPKFPEDAKYEDIYW